MTVLCAGCDAEFETSEELHTHTGEVHASADATTVGERFPCSVCGVEMTSRTNLDMHLHDAHGQSASANAAVQG